MRMPCYLEWEIWVELKLGYSLAPWLKLLGLRVNKVVKQGALGGKLDRLELRHPPFCELNAMVNQLQSTYTSTTH